MEGCLFSILVRHLGLNHKPDLMISEDFCSWGASYVTRKAQEFNLLYMDDCPFTVYLQKVEPRKRPIYEAGMREFVDGKKLS